MSDREGLVLFALLLAWGAVHLAPRCSGVDERRDDLGARPAPAAAGVKREVPARAPAPPDATEGLGGSGGPPAHLPGTVRRAPVASGVEVAAALVQADRYEELGLDLCCVGRRNVKCERLQLCQAGEVARIRVQPEQQAQERVSEHGGLLP